ncbi:hypothetical protein GCM10017608_05940 [Agromyces luteolus]|nr:hypothetical protein GCM10017608_05940 [Agromyces luteolus]
MRRAHADRTFAPFESDEWGAIMEIRKHIVAVALAAGVVGALGACASQATVDDDRARADSAELRAAAAGADASVVQGDRLAAYADAASAASDGTGASAAQGERLARLADAMAAAE